MLILMRKNNVECDGHRGFFLTINQTLVVDSHRLFDWVEVYITCIGGGLKEKGFIFFNRLTNHNF